MTTNIQTNFTLSLKYGLFVSMFFMNGFVYIYVFKLFLTKDLRWQFFVARKFLELFARIYYLFINTLLWFPMNLTCKGLLVIDILNLDITDFWFDLHTSFNIAKLCWAFNVLDNFNQFDHYCLKYYQNGQICFTSFQSLLSCALVGIYFYDLTLVILNLKSSFLGHFI